MLNKLLSEIVVSVVGKQAESVVGVLNSPKYVNEFVLAKKMDLIINQTRNILYQLSGLGLVSSVRKKDKKKGWYTYYWRFEILKCLEYIKNLTLKQKLEIEEDIFLKNSKIFYECAPCGLEFDEDQALLMNFTCDECGEVFTVKDNSKIIKDLERMLKKLEEKLGLIDEEIEKERSKIDKKRTLKVKKEQKEKEKLKKKSSKKVVNKSVKKVAKKFVKKVAKKVIKKKVAKKKVVKKATKKKSLRKVSRKK